MTSSLRKLPNWLVPVLVAALFGGISTTDACNVPVFRFALERWRPDPYPIVVLHRGSLPESEKNLVDRLADQAAKPGASLAVKVVDLSTDDRPPGLLKAPPQLDQLPWLLAMYPEHLKIDSAAWSGSLSDRSLAGLTDSPVRRELVKRLVAGETAVWLFVDSGNTDADQKTLQQIEEELAKLSAELKLPELTDSPDDALLTSSPLRIAFSVLRLSAKDPAEQALASMLMHSEPDLIERSDPLVFPVFGRGRALFPLVGAGINAANIREAASFLVGPCSCQVKELNPGFDLLLNVDWDALLQQEGVVLSAVASEQRAKSTDEVEFVPIPGGAVVAQSGKEAMPEEPAATNHSASAGELLDPADAVQLQSAVTAAPKDNHDTGISWAGGAGLLAIVVVALTMLLLRK